MEDNKTKEEILLHTLQKTFDMLEFLYTEDNAFTKDSECYSVMENAKHIIYGKCSFESQCSSESIASKEQFCGCYNEDKRINSTQSYSQQSTKHLQDRIVELEWLVRLINNRGKWIEDDFKRWDEQAKRVLNTKS